MTTNGGPARVLRVYGWWIVLVTAVVMGAAYGVSMLTPTTYQAQAIVVVEARVQANTTPVAPEMGTEKELAHSGLIVQPAAQQLGVDPDALDKGLTVSVATDANVLTFSYVAKDAADAQARAQALAETYVAYRNSGTAATSAKNGVSASAHATLVTAATLPTKPQARPIWIDLGAGLVIGLLLGIGTAILRDRVSDRIRGRDDFEAITGATVLATVPRIKRSRGADPDRPILLRAPESPAAESYRYLRSRLQPLLRDGRATVLVASAAEHEGRSTTAANLALALAMAGRTVVLVDADLRHPRQHGLLGLSDRPGLTDLLRGDVPIAGALQDGPVSRLRLLAAGSDAQTAADLLEGARLAWALRVVRQQCDVVVLDSAAVLSVSDAIALAGESDHVLLVGDCRSTTRAGLARALAELDGVRADVSGVLVNAPRSAGGLVPEARAGVPVPAGDDMSDSYDTVAIKIESSAYGSAAIPRSLTPREPLSSPTTYRSASVSAPINPPHAAGPVKKRANDSSNGASTVPSPRGSE